jgi:hypothetical protein
VLEWESPHGCLRRLIRLRLFRLGKTCRWARRGRRHRRGNLMADWITGPEATIVASLVAALFAAAQVCVARALKNIAYNKLKCGAVSQFSNRGLCVKRFCKPSRVSGICRVMVLSAVSAWPPHDGQTGIGLPRFETRSAGGRKLKLGMASPTSRRDAWLTRWRRSAEMTSSDQVMAPTVTLRQRAGGWDRSSFWSST